MAPEMIMAMEHGTYDVAVDIWSLGITCIELAERKPPLFELNAMTALYHIPQKDPPKLKGGHWSSSFESFVKESLTKDPAQRPTAHHLIKHPFITQKRPDDTIYKLVERTKSPDLQKANSDAMDAVLKSVSQVTGLAKQADMTEPYSAAAPNKRVEGKPRASVQALETGILSSIDERPSASTSENETSLQSVRTNRWLTQNANIQHQVVSAQLQEIRKLRRSQAKALEVAHGKQAAEISKILSRATSEMDQIVKTKEKELEKHLAKSRIQLESHDKAEVQELKAFLKVRKTEADKRRSTSKRDQQNTLKHAKSEVLKDETLSKAEKKKQLLELKDKHVTMVQSNSDRLESRIEYEDKIGELEFQLSRLPLTHAMTYRQLQEEVELIIRHNNSAMDAKKRRRDVLVATYKSHADELITLQRKSLQDTFDVELAQAKNQQRDS
eukprot:m.168775 g.168775  ORF g.168775 m.168775 type:complete len:441 (-) comp18221_c0_seq3:1165-2487(-)